MNIQQNVKKYLEILQACPLFEGVQMQEMESLLDCMGARMMAVGKGQTVFREGDPATAIGIVLDGMLQLSRQDYDGKRSIVAHLLGGDLFAEAFAFARHQVLPVTVTAEQDSCVLLLDSVKLSMCCCNGCQFHSRVIFNLLRISADKNVMLHRKLQILSKRTTREKLLAYLQQQALSCGSREFTIPYDRQALADYLEVERSGLSVQISKLCQEGVIACSRRHFQLL